VVLGAGSVGYCAGVNDAIETQGIPDFGVFAGDDEGRKFPWVIMRFRYVAVPKVGTEPHVDLERTAGSVAVL
jgi:hypothetical protein